MADPAAPERDELFPQAIRAAYAVLTAGPLTEFTVAAALDAAQAVYDAEHEAYVQRQLDEARIEHMNIGGNGGIDARFVMARETAASLMMAAKDFLSAYPAAENYVEQQVFDRETGDRYLVTFTKPGGKTPHELRRQAEAERDRLAAEVERLSQELSFQTGRSLKVLDVTAYPPIDDHQR